MSTLNGGPKYLLDTLPGRGAAAAYSLRRLSNSYTGSLVRVRRDFDNLEQDIGFTLNGDLDTVGLTSFVGYQNLFSYSEQFENSSWSLNNVSVNSNVTNSPISTLTADKIVENTANALHATSRGLTVSVGTTYYWSIYLKAAERTYGYISIVTGGAATIRYVINIDLSNGNVTDIKSANSPTGISYSVTNVGNSWFRCSVSITATSTTLYVVAGASNSATPTYDPTYNDVTYPGISGYGIYVWGAQLNSSALQSYQQTTTAARTATSYNGFVTTWYDQSGNSKIATQTTAASQPRIVSSGVVDTQNSKPALYFNIGKSFTSPSFTVSGSLSSFTVFNNFATNTYVELFSIAGNTTSGIAWNIITGTTSSDWVKDEAIAYGNGYNSGRAPRLVTFGQFYFTSTSYISSLFLNSSINGLFKNNVGASYRINSIGSIPSITNTLLIGTNANTTIPELIIYSIDKYSSRTQIESNINNYYKIY